MLANGTASKLARTRRLLDSPFCTATMRYCGACGSRPDPSEAGSYLATPNSIALLIP